jgi:hypothetical protein
MFFLRWKREYSGAKMKSITQASLSLGRQGVLKLEEDIDRHSN